MKPLSYYVDKCIIAVYMASLLGGVLVCMQHDAQAAGDNKKVVNIRYVASVNGTDYMTADDFLQGSEKAADKEGIKDYLDNLKKNGLTNGNEPDEPDDEDIYTDEVPIETEEEPEAAVQEKNDAPVIDPDDWRLILVNKQNPVPDDFTVKLSGISDSMQVDERIIADVYSMMDAASDDGVNLMICSAYRSYDRQKTLFNNKINKLMGEGMTYLEAYKVGSMNVTVPGTSEHHLGLALDILTGSYTKMDDGFGDTEAGKWLAENASDYGFILRYPKGKEDITGIVYEPWHFRYVGREYAKDIEERGVCLEEYLKGDL